MTTYELLIDAKMKKLGREEYMKHENSHVIKASIESGIVAALFTNFLEVIVVRK